MPASAAGLADSTIDLAPGKGHVLQARPHRSELHGQSMANLFHLPWAKTVSTTTLRSAEVEVTRLSGESGTGMSLPFAMTKGYVVALQLQDATGNELWKADRQVSCAPFMAGSLAISHLDEGPSFNLREPFDFLLLHIPERVFDEIADEYGARRIDRLNSQTRAYDSVLHHLARALLPLLDTVPPAGSGFFDHVTMAICLRLAQGYGAPSRSAADRSGALSPSQIRMAKDMLSADLTGQPVLDHVARACGVSAGRFIRSFREATGLPPYRWLRSFRVDRAKQLLLNTSLSLAQIAYECGFADQSHFTRVFAAAVHMTPAVWRRLPNP